MRRLARRRHLAQTTSRITSGVLALALLATACAGAPPIHTGALPTGAPTVAPHVIDGDPIAPGTTLEAPPTLPLGLREDQLPFGLSFDDISLGALAAAVLLGSVAVVLGTAWAVRLARGLGRARPQPIEVRQPGVVFDGLSRFPAEYFPQSRVRVPPIATPDAAPPTVAHSSMANAVPVSQTLGAPEAIRPPEPPAIIPAPPPQPTPLRPPSEASPAELGPPQPTWAARSARGLGALAGRTRGLTAGGTEAAGGLAKWASERAQASGRALAAVPRSAWNDLDRRRSPFRDGGEFWVRGTALLRMGVQQEAERHYWSGFYECEARGWEIEGAECLRRLGHLAALRGEPSQAIHHLEAAATTFERRADNSRLSATRDEILQIAALLGAAPIVARPPAPAGPADEPSAAAAHR